MSRHTCTRQIMGGTPKDEAVATCPVCRVLSGTTATPNTEKRENEMSKNTTTTPAATTEDAAITALREKGQSRRKAPAAKATTTKAPAKAKATKAAPAKATKAAAPAPAKAAAPAPAPAKAPKVKAYTVPTGYAVKYPHGGYDLLTKVNKDTEGPAWWVTCNAHGDMTDATTAKAGDALGRKAEMVKWCKGHKAAAAKAAK